MSFILDQVATLVGNRCVASTVFQAAITGGTFYGRAPDVPVSYPYAVFWFDRDGNPFRQTDGSSVQRYTLRMAVYCLPGATASGSETGMNDAVTKNPTGWGAPVMQCLEVPFDGKFAKELRQAQDVFVVGGQWVMTLSQSVP